jgi:hypothetical protein
MSSDETASTYRTLLACDGIVFKHVALACEENSSHCIGNARILWSRELQAAVCILMAWIAPPKECEIPPGKLSSVLNPGKDELHKVERCDLPKGDSESSTEPR